MVGGPPKSTRPDKRFPYTTPFRSRASLHAEPGRAQLCADGVPVRAAGRVAARRCRDHGAVGHAVDLGRALYRRAGDRRADHPQHRAQERRTVRARAAARMARAGLARRAARDARAAVRVRSEEHTSELQSLMRISYAVFCLKEKSINTTTPDDEWDRQDT